MKTSIHRLPRKYVTGLSLIELMISIALGLIILSAVVGVFVNASAARNELERTSRQIENGRYAVEVLSDDVRLSGFFGELGAGVLALPGAVPDPCTTTTANMSASMALHVQGYDDGAGVPGTCPLTNLKLNTDILVVRRAKTCVAGVAGCEAEQNNKPYVQVTLCDSEAVTPYVMGLSGVTPFPLRKRDCATAAGMREYLTHIYYVSTDNGSGQNVPTLKRLQLQAGNPPAFEDRPLVEGIELFQVEYGIDTDGDGNPDVYTADPLNHTYGGCPAPCAVNNWANVVTVSFHVLARNIDASPGYLDTKTYNLGRDAAGAIVTVGPFNNGYRRHAYAGLVRAVNPAGRRDTP